ncbi:spore germination protein (amino acid permease) [Oceanobacillus limi]|uniref:Spore germination protein (Amino acid permease) n=1 Tax=Oceanobacillus limi TaxID=930131 RepID=A0A1I0D7B6_9BACI|nr:endospore germination permease [Oceanobacillus limi]SET28079.1 spore germination protein (amino acid permease) [Oceanobacillus limi]
MEQSKGKIGVKEFIAIIILMTGTKLADDTPAILYEKLSNAGWVAPLIIGVISIIPVFLLIKVTTTYQNKNLIEVVDHVFGRIIGFFIILFLWIISYSALIIDSAIYTDIIGTMYFVRTPTIVIYALLMAVCAYGGKRGFEQIGSTAWAVIPYIKASLFLALILSFNKGNFAFIHPIFGPGEWEVLKESTLKLSIFADLLFIFILYPLVKSKKDFTRGVWISLIILSIELTLAMLAYVFLFDYKTVEMLNYPFHEAIRSVEMGFLSNMETFFFPFWLISSFVRFSVYIYITAILFGRLFKIDHFEYVIPSIATLVVFIGLIPESPTHSIFELRETLINLTTPVYFILPFLLWIVAKLKGDFKHDNKNGSKDG